MSALIVEKANAKLNLALHVVGRRGDGYHELDSIVAFADICDVVSIVPSEAASFNISGPFAAGLAADQTNSVVKAASGMKQLYAAHGVALPPLAITLEKNLPVASGIGGGSADAAATLRAVMRLAQHQLPEPEIYGLALSLGADVPVCVAQRSCRMQGIGEDLRKLESPPAGAVILVNPMQELSTKAVFERLGVKPGTVYKSALDPDDQTQWRNDLLPPALQLCPVIADVLKSFPDHLTSGMSGSGATCFALCDSSDTVNAVAAAIARDHPSWWIRSGRLL